MKRIQVLSKHTVNQIAAGEVVERPASVIKELVENSIDAGSTAITVEITGGGIEYMRVADNGSGILAEDVPTAFLSHATSKIASAEDLDCIATLGFRGEALASIAAVSRLTMKTRTKNADAGTVIRIEGGEVKECTDIGCTDGTAIEVSNLFYNVPARLRFLKSQRTEAGYISDYVARAIMGNPAVSFRFINNGKVVYHSSGDGSLKSAVYCVYGSDVLPHLKEVNYDDGCFAITGYLGNEKLSRPNRQQQSLYINSRYIRSSQISYGIQRAFDTRMMVGKFPFYVLNIKVNPQDVDVNVHPNKMEVRFKDEQGAVRAATIAARMALGDPVAPVLYKEEIRPKTVQTQFVQKPAANNFVQTAEKSAEVKQPAVPVNNEEELFKPAPKNTAKFKDSGTAPVIRSYFTPAPPADFSVIKPLPKDAPKPEKSEPVVEVIIPAPKIVEVKKEKAEQIDFGIAPYKIIGQLFGCYWVVQQGDNVFFIDQHAAHERKLYDSFMEADIQADSQMLLVPVVEKLSPMEYETLTSNIDLFRNIGFDIEEFGVFTVSVRAVPSIFYAPETVSFLHEAIGELEAKNRLSTAELKKTALIQSACKHAIKAGMELTTKEIDVLLKEFAKFGAPMTCPHGRPIMLQMSKGEFEKLFKRVT